MKHQRIQTHLSWSAHLQMSQIQNIFTNFSYNQNIPQKYKISSDAQKSSRQSQNEKKCAQPWLIKLYMINYLGPNLCIFPSFRIQEFTTIFFF